MLTYQQFYSRIRNLKLEKYGKTLKQGCQPGHYMYEEKILRGYVRMQAEANSVEILNESQEAEIKQYITVSSRKTGYFGSKPPKGWDNNKSAKPIVLSSAPKGNFRRNKDR